MYSRTAPDSFIFDVDGVLINVRRSYPEVIREGIRLGWHHLLGRKDVLSSPFCDEHLRVTKRHPGFNDDYDIAWAFLAAAASSGKTSLDEAFPSPKDWERTLNSCPRDKDIAPWVIASFGNGPSREETRRLCEELYFGSDYERIRKASPRYARGAGLWRSETPELSLHWSSLPLPCGIYTGRPRDELALALEKLGWQDFPSHLCITPEDGILKPSPEGLRLLAERMKSLFPLYFGDAQSDLEAQLRFGRGLFVAIGDVLTDHSPRRNSLREALNELDELCP